MKRILTLALAVAMIASLCMISAFAVNDNKYDITATKVAPVQDGTITAAEYANNAPIILDGSGKHNEGSWASDGGKEAVWTTQKLTVYYTWDAEYLYFGMTVEGDNTKAVDGAVTDTCPWGHQDMIQIGFNPGNIIVDREPWFFCVGMANNTTPVVHGDAFRSEENGSQSEVITDLCKAYCAGYNADGINYCLECAFPWSEIFVKGVARNGADGAPLCDFTGEAAKLGEGYELPFTLIYADQDDAEGGHTYIRSDVNTAADGSCSWVAQEMGHIKLVFHEAPADDTPTDPVNPDTGDTGLALAIGSMILAAGCVVVLKKRH